MASGLVDNLILLINPFCLYSLATSSNSFCLATLIAVNVPPKNDTSTVAPLLIVLKYSSIVFLTSSANTSSYFPAILS